MNIHYKIVLVQESDHTIVARYWTDNISELSLAISDRLLPDGSPERCRTDVAITLPIPEPSPEEIERIIQGNAPVAALKIFEMKARSDKPSMDGAKQLLGQTKTLEVADPKPIKTITNEEIDDVISKLFKGKKKPSKKAT